MSGLIRTLERMATSREYTYIQICAIDSASVYLIMGDVESARNILTKFGIEGIL